jgi:UDP-N-acetylmuramoyl-L-alanyl-D-glutamate--2,6-diaminopimelate ligase
MLLSDLVSSLVHISVRGPVHAGSREVRRVSRDSRDVDALTAFVAIRGSHVDGHAFLGRLGLAALLVVEDATMAPFDVPVLVVPDSKVALAQIASLLAGQPARAMRMVGVTGTKGKTTTTTLIEGALTHAGRIAGRIGTTGSSVGGRVIPSALTTPEAPELQALLAEMRDAGATDVAMEVSSIGLAQHRVDGIPFHFAIFTNLGRDHLDFHGTMLEYQRAKARLFEQLLRPSGGAPRAAICSDDPCAAGIGAPSDTWRFGFESGADFRIRSLAMRPQGMQFELQTPFGRVEMRSALVGRHNALNLAGALAACLACELPLDVAVAGLESVHAVAGRLEGIPNDRGLLVVVDYAHTPESLAAVLHTLREVTEGRLWVVFGCGGDRDPGKRPLMGKVASELADAVVVTSDNPRREDPHTILHAIVQGMPRPPAWVGDDRADAIRWAIGEARAGDAVLIAGKGHETYQEMGSERLPFDDREVARAALWERGVTHEV